MMTPLATVSCVRMQYPVYALWLVLAAFQNLLILDGRRISVVLIGAECLWCKITIVNGAHRHHDKDEHTKIIRVFVAFLTSYCLIIPN